MEVIESTKIVYFDVDDTLVMWNSDASYKIPFRIKNDEFSNSIYHLSPNTSNINLMRRCKKNGCTIVVWSKGGWDWCEVVVKRLGLENIVDVCMSKPDTMVDDKPDGRLPRPIYLSPEGNWGLPEDKKIQDGIGPL